MEGTATPWDETGQFVATNGFKRETDTADKGSSVCPAGSTRSLDDVQSSCDEELCEINTSRWRCMSVKKEWDVLKEPREDAKVIAKIKDGEEIEVVATNETPDAEYLELKNGGYVLKEEKADGFIPSSLCPLVGTWEYEFHGKFNKYAIVHTDRELYYHERELKIPLRHCDDKDAPPLPEDEYLTAPTYGGTADYNRTIWFQLSEGKLLSIYTGNNSSPVRVMAKRLALHDSRPVSPIQGDTHPSEPGQSGLWNIGNTCFMNSAIQCVSSCEELITYFRKDAYKKHLNRTNPLGAKGRLAEEFATLMQAMWSGGYSSVRPNKLKKVIDEFAPRFSGYQQHDSHELLSFLLDGLHEDVNTVKDKPYTPDDDVSKLNEQEKAELAWRRHRERNQSTVASLFEGQLRSVIKCNLCSHQESKFDPMTSVSLPCQLDSSLNTVLTVCFLPQNVCKPIVKYLLKMKNTEDLKAVKREISLRVSLPEANLMILETETKLVTDFARDQVTVYETPPHSSEVSIMRLKDPVQLIFWHMLVVPKDITKGECYSLVCQTLSRAKRGDSQDCSMSENGDLNDEDDEHPLQFNVSSSSYKPLTLEAGLQDEVRLDKFIVKVGIKRKVVDGEGNKEVEKWKDEVGNVHYKTLEECIEKYTEEEQLDEANTWYCPKCKEHVRAYKSLSVWKVPKYLVIHLNRFSFMNTLYAGRFYGDGIRRKVDTDVRYTDSIDLSPSLAKESPARSEAPVYDLYAVSCHMGSATGGHYTAYTKAGGAWHHYNDRYVSPSSLREACTPGAYLLFYSRREPQSRNSSPPPCLSNGLSESPTEDFEPSPKNV
eukprot:TRINITY_DN34474_c0_g1_i1.p1 TRINITY_DN34474_c0_g1~~TRINITY_DN34474_c0_g1_i1.p1  ORF type:complete len:874 (+),score=187.50 TRINITY_DN34474_c0_g1_i1:148-2622(+)